MSSSLVWLPPKKYDSIKSLWQDQYIWSALPVDNTIPLDRTSFIDISEDDAKAARSRSNTLRSRASTGCIRHVQDGEEAQKLNARTQAVKNEEGGEISQIEARKNGLRSHGHTHTSSTSALRPNALSYNRLRSFHLPARIQTENPPAAAESSPIEAEPADAVSPTLQEIIVVDEERDETTSPVREPIIRKVQSDDALRCTREEAVFVERRNDVPTNVEEVVSRVSKKSERGRGRKANHASQRSSGNRRANRGERKLPDDSLKPISSNVTRQSKQTSLRLSLNLEVEVQLKVSLHGDVMLSLLD